MFMLSEWFDFKQDLVDASGQGFRQRRKSEQQRGVQFFTLGKIVRSCGDCHKSFLPMVNEFLL